MKNSEANLAGGLKLYLQEVVVKGGSGTSYIGVALADQLEL